ncbi:MULTISPECIES: hypothetical protein [unclassified Archaeoglobus]|jgi:apolipoprotein N-acyltransferase|uniref:hypothetical protein n=1 Tax=unclassified Archaeoglobus TaxID=2643606 RepID=UPI0025B9A7FD|nr:MULTISPECIES: hypothetical protein [unclassified Archaeoglobus]
MKKRYLLMLLIGLAIIFAGCQGKKTEEREIAPSPTPTPTSTVNEIVQENVDQELQELEQLLKELESLDDVNLEV